MAAIGLTFRPSHCSLKSSVTRNQAFRVCAVKGSNSAAPAQASAPLDSSLVVRSDDPLAGREYRPPQEGDGPDFWEGPKWNLFGTFMEYLWIFGIFLAVLSSVYAVSNYSGSPEQLDENSVEEVRPY